MIANLSGHDCDVVASSRANENETPDSWTGRIDFKQADLNEDRQDWYQFFGEPDMVIHLAWGGLPNYKELYHLERNLYRNYSFLKNMIASGLKQAVVAGTCFEYGMQCGELKEDMEARPNTPYALAKDCLRKFLQQVQRRFDYDLKWIRVFYPFGKGQSPHSILSQLELAIAGNDKAFNMSGGEQLRDYLPVEKTAEYIVRIAMQQEVSGIVNCCSGQPTSIRTLVEEYIAGRDSTIDLNFGYYPYNDYEPMAFWGSTRKLSKALGEVKQQVGQPK